ncbi:MAG: hypothetical protein GY711_04120 [bacterium]|nr:hypothetical protein [bacterium]
MLVAPDELGPVSTWLIEQGVRFDEDEEASQSCAGPVLHVLCFPPSVGRTELQRVLDAYPRGMRAE